MGELTSDLADAIIEILDSIYAAQPHERIEEYLSKERITREQLAAATIASMILERYKLTPAT